MESQFNKEDRFRGNDNMNSIIVAIDNLPSADRDYVYDIFKNAPFSIFQEMSLLTIHKGKVFIQEEAPADRIYYLLEGEVQAVEHRVLGSSYYYMNFRAVEVFGPMEVLLDMKCYRTTLMTKTDCKFIMLKRESYERWIENDAHVLRIDSKATCTYLLKESRRSRLFRFMSGKDSILMMIMQEYEERADERGICEMQWTRQQLSEYSGLSLRTVNRAVQAMEDEGYINHHRGYFKINKEQYNRIKEYLDSFVDEI